MKIRLSELRRIIREVLDQEADLPGRFRGSSSGEDLDDEDKQRLGNRGFLSTKRKLKKRKGRSK